MEAHIVRSKKKKDRKGKGEKGFDSNSNSPRNGSHRSPTLHQVSIFRCRPYETLSWCSFAATVSSILSKMKKRITEQTSEETRDGQRHRALSFSHLLLPSTRFPLAVNCYPIRPYTGRTRESTLPLYQTASTARLSSISTFRAIFYLYLDFGRIVRTVADFRSCGFAGSSGRFAVEERGRNSIARRGW